MNWVRSLVWIMLKHWIRRQFPTVKLLSTTELAQQLQQPDAIPPILLDARTREEFETSHLPHAHWVSKAGGAIETRLPPDRPIVVYCSVGYRSARFAQQLQTAGYQNVFNLEGSLFEWVNHGHPVYRHDEPRQAAEVKTGDVTGNLAEQVTDRVHPYNHLWGWLLTPR